MNELNVWQAPDLPFNLKEIRRYAGIRGAAEQGGDAAAEGEMDAVLQGCLSQVGQLRCRGVWRVFPILKAGPALDLGFTVTESRSLSAFLGDCEAVVLLAMTAGMEMDRLIAGAAARSPLRELMMHAIGAERVETACDAFERELERTRGPGRVKGRFSPGYGDVPLSMQRFVFQTLGCEKNAGIYLNEATLLMTPSKSVTALVGLRPAAAGPIPKNKQGSEGI